MADHPSDFELLELVANRLPAAARARVEAHLAACPACRAQRDEAAQTYAALGAWTPALRARDLTADVLSAVVAAEAAATRPIPLRLRLGAAARIAAAVTVAATVGHVAARYAFPGAAPALTPLATESAAAQALHVDDLLSDGPADLADAVLNGPEAADPETRG